MKNPIRYGVMGLLASATMFAVGEARGQEAENSAKQRTAGVAASPSPATPDARDPVWFGPIVNIEFPGGTVEEYISALQRAARDKTLNVIAPREALRVMLPAITLRDVSAFTALSALESAFERNSEHQFFVRRVTGSSAESAAYAVGYQKGVRGTQFPGAQAVQDSRAIEVYSIRDLIEPPAGVQNSPESRMAYESILGAIEAAIGMLEGSEPIKLMYHKETGLMLVGGTVRQTEMVNSVITRLREDLQKRWQEESVVKRQNVEQTRRLAAAKLEMDMAEQEHQIAAKQFASNLKRAEGGLVSRDELALSEAAAAKAKMVYDRRQMEYEAAQEEIGVPLDREKKTVLYDLQDLLQVDDKFGDRLGEVVESMGGKSHEMNKCLVVEADSRTHRSVEKVLGTVRNVVLKLKK